MEVKKLTPEQIKDIESKLHEVDVLLKQFNADMDSFWGIKGE